MAGRVYANYLAEEAPEAVIQAFERFLV